MSDAKKYLRRPDIEKLIVKIESALLEIVRQHLDRAGLPYEILDAPPASAGESEGQKRRRAS